MADGDNSWANPMENGVQDDPLCSLLGCRTSIPSAPVILPSSIDISTTLPLSDVSSTTSHLSTSISSPSATTTPTSISTSSNPSSLIRHLTTPTTSAQTVQPTSLPVNIASSVSSGEPKSITTTILSTNGIEVVTITSVIENPAAILNRPVNNGDSNSFMTNRAAVIGVFTAVGVTTLVLFLTLVLYIFRKRQARRQLEKDHAAAAAGARRILDDEDELGNEKGWWHGDSGTSLPATQPVYHNSGPLDYSRPFAGAAHPYASTVPTPNRMAPPVDTRSSHQASVQPFRNYGSPSTDFGTTNAQVPTSTEGYVMSSFAFDHAPQPTGQSTSPPPVQIQESSGSAHPYASLRGHKAYDLLAGDVLAQQSLYHGPAVQHSSTEVPGSETAARGHSPGILTTSTPVVHNSPLTTTSDLFASGSRSGSSADKEQWYDDTDSESHAGSRKSGLVPPSPSVQQDFVERAKHPAHGPRFSGLFGPSTAWAPTYPHHPRDSVDAGTIREEDQERFGGNGRVLTVTNA